MIRRVFQMLIGERLPNSHLSREKYDVLGGMAILSSDAISSVAYAVEEMMWVLTPTVGVLAYFWMPKIALAIVTLLWILTFSYRQTVEAYPNGGGAYIVAKSNLNVFYGLIAGASLSADYVLTVAVSVCAGTAAITSAFPVLYQYRVLISIASVFILTIGNLRGIRESTKIFSIPTYAFIVVIFALIGAGMTKALGGGLADVVRTTTSGVSFGEGAVTIALILKAFSSGCSALTGVEAISNAVPNFAPPSSRNAKFAYLLLASAVMTTFGGVAYLATVYRVVPNLHQTVITQLSLMVFGRGIMFYIIQALTAIILSMAANTAFADFPMLLSVVARDGYAPRQLSIRGHRLSYSNGIITLAVLASMLIVIFNGSTHLLIPLYSVGVFTSFTLSQTGMFLHWLRLKPEHWHYKAAINGLGAIITGIAVVIIGATKFALGAWVVLIVIPILVLLMLRIKEHYNTIAAELDVPNEMLSELKVEGNYRHHIVVPVFSLNLIVVRALRYATSLTSNVVAFHVETFEGEADKLREKWKKLNTNVPLIIKQSPYRDVVNTLIEYINSEEHESKPGDMITILLPQFIVPKWWQVFLHNNTSVFITNSLLSGNRNIVVSVLPHHIRGTKFVDSKLNYSQNATSAR